MRRRRKPPLRTLVAWTVLLLLASGSAAPAQTDSRLGDQLQRTDEALARAGEIVRESESLRARETFEQALNLQKIAWEKFRERQLLVSARLTGEARNLGARAVTMAREDAQLRARARREGEAAELALQRAREELGPAASPSARLLLERARSQIERGRVQFHEQHYEAALRLAISAQRLIRQALGAGLNDGALGSRVLRELERTDHLIDRARTIVGDGDDPEARELLERAADLQHNAWSHYREGRHRVAQATTREARSLLQRAVSLVQGSVDPDRVERAVAETDRLLGRVAELVRDSGDEGAARTLENALEQQRQAKDLLREGQLRAALAKTRVARRLATRAAGMVETGDSR
jgi:hypothetical protein